MRLFAGLCSTAALVMLIPLARADVVADTVVCQDPSVRHMHLPEDQAGECLDAGYGTPGPGSGVHDPFLNGVGAAFEEYLDSGDGDAGIAWAQTGNDSNSAWGTWSVIPGLLDPDYVHALAFQFGRPNTPNSWFVYELLAGVSSGTWYVDGAKQGLSHIVLYRRECTEGEDCGPSEDVPEPGTLALLGLGLSGLGLGARRRKKA